MSQNKQVSGDQEGIEMQNKHDLCELLITDPWKTENSGWRNQGNFCTLKILI